MPLLPSVLPFGVRYQDQDLGTVHFFHYPVIDDPAKYIVGVMFQNGTERHVELPADLTMSRTQMQAQVEHALQGLVDEERRVVRELQALMNGPSSGYADVVTNIARARAAQTATIGT